MTSKSKNMPLDVFTAMTHKLPAGRKVITLVEDHDRLDEICFHRAAEDFGKITDVQPGDVASWVPSRVPCMIEKLSAGILRAGDCIVELKQYRRKRNARALWSSVPSGEWSAQVIKNYWGPTGPLEYGEDGKLSWEPMWRGLETIIRRCLEPVAHKPKPIGWCVAPDDVDKAKAMGIKEGELLAFNGTTIENLRIDWDTVNRAAEEKRALDMAFLQELVDKNMLTDIPLEGTHTSPIQEEIQGFTIPETSGKAGLDARFGFKKPWMGGILVDFDLFKFKKTARTAQKPQKPQFGPVGQKPVADQGHLLLMRSETMERLLGGE